MFTNNTLQKTKVPLLAVSALCVGLFSVNAFALPTLQLTIDGGTYNTSTQTTYANSDAFELYAILTPNLTGKPRDRQDQLDALLARTYYISVALSPQVSTFADLGSFSFAGQTIDVTADMTHGSINELSPHGIFDTYYKVFDFTFSSLATVNPVNTEPTITLPDTTGPAPALDFSATGSSYYHLFQVNVANLDPSVSIHFDLYDAVFDPQNEVAPYSHDAQSGPGGGSSGGGQSSFGTVPEPESLALLGIGMLISVFSVRNRKLSA